MIWNHSSRRSGLWHGCLFGLFCGALGLVSIHFTKLSVQRAANVVKPVVGPTLSFDLTPAQITQRCAKSLDAYWTKLDGIAARTTAGSFVDTVEAYDSADTLLHATLAPVTFLGQVAENEQVRKAALACEEDWSKRVTDAKARRDVYLAMKASFEQSKGLNRDQQYIAAEIIKDFERRGMGLPDDKRAEFVRLSKRLTELDTRFQENLNNWDDFLPVTRAQLAGLPDDFVAGLTKTRDGLYKITLDYPTALPFLEQATNADVRRRLKEKYDRRGGVDNIKLLKEAILLRYQRARLLGYPTHAAWVVSDLAAKTPTKVNQFLTDIVGKLRPLVLKEHAEFVELKKNETGKKTLKAIDLWDLSYYKNIVKKTRYDVDENAIREYYPLDHVLHGMFTIFGTTMGLSFEELPGVKSWYSGVKTVVIKDTASGQSLGYVYLDLYPRKGKYGHAAAFTLVKGWRRADGGFESPVQALVVNFPSPTPDHPSLLRHSDVETLFHEFGHVMNGIVSRAPYGSFSGLDTRTDFVEIGSQICEYWIWEKPSLRLITKHWRTGQPMPEAMMDKLIATRRASVGVYNSHYLFQSLIDQAYYSLTPKRVEDIDTRRVWDSLAKQVILLTPIPGTYPEAGFGHLLGGYDASYYAYIWTEMIAKDMFTRFQTEGLLSDKPGMDLRHKIYERGAMYPSEFMIHDFLGREPSNAPYLATMGVGE